MNTWNRTAKALAFACVMMLAWACTTDTESLTPKQQQSTVLPAGSTDVQGEYLVVLKDGALGLDPISNSQGHSGALAGQRVAAANVAAEKTLTSWAEAKGISKAAIRPFAGLANGFVAQLNESQAASFRQDQNVRVVLQDFEAHALPPVITAANSPRSGELLKVKNEQVEPWGLDAMGGARNANGSQWLWVVSSGIDLDHEDLNVVGAPFARSFVPGTGVNDVLGLGTHIAGAAAALDNDYGIVGVAAGAPVVPLKVIGNNGKVRVSRFWRALLQVARFYEPGDVVHVGFGFYRPDPVSTLLIGLLAKKGVRFVFAAGDMASEASGYYPTALNGDGLFTVSAFDRDIRLTSFSNFGNPPIDFSSPGEEVLSTWTGNSYRYLSSSQASAAYFSGALLAEPQRQSFAATCGTVHGDPDGNPDPVFCPSEL